MLVLIYKKIINNKMKKGERGGKMLMSCENRIYVKKNYNFKFNFS